MAVVKAFKWMRFLSDADEIRKKKEKTKDTNPAEMQKYKDAVYLRNLAFVELLRAGIPFICIEDDDIIRISLDETSYDIDIATVKSAMNDEEYDKIINKTDFSEGFNPDKDIAVDEQKNSEFEILQQKIASYGSTEEPDSKKDAPKRTYSGESSFINKETATHSASDPDVKDNNEVLDYRVDTDGTIRAINTKEIAVIGIERGIGTTHTVMFMAQVLAKNTGKKVAVVEINGSGTMRNLGEWILGREIETNNYPLGSVDVYFEMDYLTFTTMYKDDYDFVIVDFGCYSRKRESMKEFIRIQNKYIVASGIDWNLGKLEDFYDDFIVDKYHTSVYLIPYLEDEKLEPVKKIVRPNKVYSMPFVINPFMPDNREYEDYILKVLDEYTEPERGEECDEPEKQGFFDSLKGKLRFGKKKEGEKDAGEE